MSQTLSSIDAILLLRKSQRDRAEGAMAAAIRAELAARAASDAAEAAIASECALASGPEAGDDAVEAFARWLPGARVRAHEAAVDLDRALAQTALTRIALRTATIALEAAQSYADAQAAAARAARAKTAQAALDEQASLRHGRS